MEAADENTRKLRRREKYDIEMMFSFIWSLQIYFHASVVLLIIMKSSKYCYAFYSKE
jgi:hypothetical protein